jgi:hypothetical protein
MQLLAINLLCIFLLQNNNRKFPKSREIYAHTGEKPYRTPNRPDKNRTTPWHIIIKTTSTETRERFLKAVREKTNNIQR